MVYGIRNMLKHTKACCRNYAVASFLYVSVRTRIDVLRMEFIVHNFLTGIQAVIAGKHIADSTGNAK